MLSRVWDAYTERFPPTISVCSIWCFIQTKTSWNCVYRLSSRIGGKYWCVWRINILLLRHVYILVEECVKRKWNEINSSACAVLETATWDGYIPSLLICQTATRHHTNTIYTRFVYASQHVFSEKLSRCYTYIYYIHTHTHTPRYQYRGTVKSPQPVTRARLAFPPLLPFSSRDGFSELTAKIRRPAVSRRREIVGRAKMKTSRVDRNRGKRRKQLRGANSSRSCRGYIYTYTRNRRGAHE